MRVEPVKFHTMLALGLTIGVKHTGKLYLIGREWKSASAHKHMVEMETVKERPCI